MRLGFFTSICEEDSVWIDQYLKEAERLNIPFAIHFDRCSNETKKRMMTHPLCIGFTKEDDPEHKFSEMDKQRVLDILQREGFDWAINVDMDETWEKDALRKLEDIMRWQCDLIDYRWLTLWDDKDHIRVDGPCSGGHRAKMFNLQKGREYEFYHPVINGPRLFVNKIWVEDGCKIQKTDLVSLHWGMITKEIRQQHKDRWDKIYTNHVGKNPYGFWEWACDETLTPTIIKNDYL